MSRYISINGSNLLISQNPSEKPLVHIHILIQLKRQINNDMSGITKDISQGFNYRNIFENLYVLLHLSDVGSLITFEISNTNIIS